jgi:xanthine/CO dehydrogenase XdhC/CoxF family maturation factor
MLPLARGALQGTTGSAALDGDLVQVATPLVAQGTSAVVDHAGRQLFVDVLRPPPQLTVFGAGDDAQPLASIAAQAGFEVTVVDHRPAYLTEQRFPGVRRVLRRPGDGVDDLQLGPRHFAVVQTHALVHDRDWIAALLPRELAYIGMLGPRARSEQIMAQLGATFPDRVFAPVGLDLGADGPEQVAVSIVAEMLAVHTGREPAHLRGRKGGIHG